jgi:flagellar assembly protein FliH
MSNPAARSHSRFIPQEEIDDKSVVQWRFGAVDAPGSLSLGAPATLQDFSSSMSPVVEEVQAAPEEPEIVASAWDGARVEQMLAQARAEGHAQGLELGRAQARQEWQQRLDDYVAGAGRSSARRVDAVIEGLDSGFRQLQASMAQDLLQLACDIARQVVRQELRSQPQALLPVVREALDMLVTEGRPATIRLNPADFEALDEALRREHGAHSRIQWLADAGVAVGGVKVESGGAEVDAGLDKRWHRAVAALGLVSTWYDGENRGETHGR